MVSAFASWEKKKKKIQQRKDFPSSLSKVLENSVQSDKKYISTDEGLDKLLKYPSGDTKTTQSLLNLLSWL